MDTLAADNKCVYIALKYADTKNGLNYSIILNCQ